MDVQELNYQDQGFRDKIIWHGDGPNPYDPNRRFRFKKKMERGGSFKDRADQQGITVTYEWISNGNKSPEGRWGMLCIVAFINGQWHAWNIEHLRVDVEETGTSSVNTTERPWCRDWVDVAFIKRTCPLPGFRLRPGDWVGFFIVAHPDGVPTQSDVVSDILPVQFQGFDLPFKTRGMNWPQGHAPQLVSAPTLPNLKRKAQVDKFVQTFIYDHGFNGLHIPMNGGVPNEILEYVLGLADAGGFWVHLWMYGDRQSSTAPDDLDQDRTHQRAVCKRLDKYQNWSMGLGYDIQEWVNSDAAIARWVTYCEKHAPGHLYGARKRNLNEGLGVPEGTTPYPGGYAGWEWWIIPKSGFQNQLARALFSDDGLPSMWEERGRLRTQNRVKDFDNQTDLFNAIREATLYNVASIWSIGNGSGDYGSAPWLGQWLVPLQRLMTGPLGEPIVPVPPPPKPEPEEEEDEEMSVSKHRLRNAQVTIFNAAGPENGFGEVQFTEAINLTTLEFWVPVAEYTTTQIVVRAGGVEVHEFWAVQRSRDNNSEYWRFVLASETELDAGDKVQYIVNAGGKAITVVAKARGYLRESA